MNRNERGISSAVTYSLIVAITLALTAGMVLGADSLVSSQRDQAVADQLDVFGDRLADAVLTVDSMGGGIGRGEVAASVPPGVSMTTDNASITLDLPRRIAGVQYRVGTANVTVNSGTGSVTRSAIFLDARDSGINVTVPVTVRWADHVVGGPVNGGPIRIVFDFNDPEDSLDDKVVITRG